jgi:hypothetical protein
VVGISEVDAAQCLALKKALRTPEERRGRDEGRGKEVPAGVIRSSWICSDAYRGTYTK